MLNDLYNLFGLNKELFIFINHSTNVSILPYFLQMLSGVFKIWNFAFIYIIFCTYLAFKLKKDKINKKDFDNIFDRMFIIGSIYAFFGVSYAALKFSVNMPRPYCSMDINNFITISDISESRCNSSFPSAHTALAILVSYFLWPYAKAIIFRIALILITLLVAISRITLAMHYPSDIIYSIIITALIIVAGHKICKILLRNKLLIHIKNSIYYKLAL